MDKILLNRKRALELTSESLPLSSDDLQFVLAFSNHFKKDKLFLKLMCTTFFFKGFLDVLLITTLELFLHFSTGGLNRKYGPYTLQMSRKL